MQRAVIIHAPTIDPSNTFRERREATSTAGFGVATGEYRNNKENFISFLRTGARARALNDAGSVRRVIRANERRNRRDRKRGSCAMIATGARWGTEEKEKRVAEGGEGGGGDDGGEERRKKIGMETHRTEHNGGFIRSAGERTRRSPDINFPDVYG